MRTLVRRFLVVATLSALLLGVAATAAPQAFAAAPLTNTRAAGINVDKTTIPQLESLMNRHRLTSVQLVQFYLHRIARLNPKLHAVIKVSRTALADAGVNVEAIMPTGMSGNEVHVGFVTNNPIKARDILATASANR